MHRGDGDTESSETGPEEQVTLEFWTYEEGRGNPYHEAFQAEHPNIDIEFTYFPSENYSVKLDTAVAAGETPELVVAFDLNYLIEGLRLPLDDVVAEHGIDLSTYNRGIIEGPGEFSCSWEGKLYCLASNQGAGGSSTTKTCSTRRASRTRIRGPRCRVEEFADIACQLTDEDAGVWRAAVR